MIAFRVRALAHRALPLALALAGAPLGAQGIAQRIATAPNGEVRLSYASRSGVCGDGRDVVARGRVLYVHGSMESYGRWSGVECVPGPVRVTLAVRDRAVTDLRVRVGTAAATAAGTDLGVVAAAAAADYFLELAARADAPVAKEAVLAAAIADSADVATRLIRIARDAARPKSVRHRAVQWAGETGGAAIVPELDALARGADDERSVREAALAGLSNAGGESGVEVLMRYVRRSDDAWLARKAVFWLGQSESADARRLLRALVDSAAAPEELRGAAIFALGHGGDVSADDIAFLQRAYPKLPSTKLRDQVLMAVSQYEGGGTKWLIERARDENEPLESRRKAAFWAGQGGAPVADLVSLYRGAKEPELRKHLLFVLSQRDDRAATDELLNVAKSDADPAMRRQAMFWLGQKDDPRVAAMIRDIVTH